MAAGLRATAKVVEHPPEPKVGAPVLDPTAEVRYGSRAPIGADPLNWHCQIRRNGGFGADRRAAGGHDLTVVA